MPAERTSSLASATEHYAELRCSAAVRHAFRIVVIGASAGGVEALQTLVAAMPKTIDAAIFIVLHIGHHQSQLPWLLNRLGGPPAQHGRDGDPIAPGRIYIAPPDHHMIVERGRIGLTKGPRENWARPAIDPLFRSAAEHYGSDVIGIILTGALNDGTAGLYQVAEAGGVTIVQDPDDAVNPSMPQSALAHVDVDHCVAAVGIAPLLMNLISPVGTGTPRRTELIPGKQPQKEGKMIAEFKEDRPVAVTCPDCGGALRRRELGSLTQFACHIGHVYTAEVMVAAQFLMFEHQVEAALRALNERAELCREMAEKARDSGNAGAALWDAAMNEAHEREAILQGLLQRDWIHPCVSETLACPDS